MVTVKKVCAGYSAGHKEEKDHLKFRSKGGFGVVAEPHLQSSKNDQQFASREGREF